MIFTSMGYILICLTFSILAADLIIDNIVDGPDEEVD